MSSGTGPAASRVEDPRDAIVLQCPRCLRDARAGGLPAPVGDLAARTWDAIVVGAGHNGRTCAAYLARAGRRVPGGSVIAINGRNAAMEILGTPGD